MSNFIIEEIYSDATKHLACREGDVLSFICYKGGITTNEAGYDIIDVWAIGAGDFVTITNRIEDLPDWLELYPTQVTGRNIPKMLKKFSDGYTPQFYSKDYENIWKPNISDFILWVGEPRSGITSQGDVLGIFRFRAGSVVVLNFKKDEFELEGRESIKYLNSTNSDKLREPYNFIMSLGIPRELANGWKLG